MRLGIARWFNKVKVNAKSPELGGTSGGWWFEPPHHLILPRSDEPKGQRVGLESGVFAACPFFFLVIDAYPVKARAAGHFSPRLQSQKNA